MRRTLLALVLFTVAVSAQTTRSFALQEVFVTYVQHPDHWTDPSVTGPAFSTQINNFWHSAAGSWGAITYTHGSTLGWLDTTISNANCPAGDFYGAVNTAYGAVPAGTIRHIIMPPGTNCNSQAQMPGNTLWTVGGGFKEHEVGHTLGLAHSPAMYPDGSTHAQGPFGIMGDGTYGDAIPTYQRIQLGVFSSTFALATVAAPVGGGAAQDITLQFVDTSAPGVKGLRATQDTKNAFGQIFTTTLLTAEFRGGDYLSTGVIIRDGSGTLRTTNPSQQNYWRMVLGQTFCVGAACVALVTQTASTATVHVTVAGPTGHKPSKLTQFSVIQ